MQDLTQTHDILDHLKRYGSITSLEAIYDYGATRLSAIIHSLRKRGYIIKSVIEKGKTRYQRPTQWVRYYYCGFEEKTIDKH